MKEKQKCFHVSPFFDIAGSYRFDISEPGARLRVAIQLKDRDAPRLDATISAERCTLNNAAILRQVAALPLLAAKVVRSEERRVGKEWFSTGRSRGSPYH